MTRGSRVLACAIAVSFSAGRSAMASDVSDAGDTGSSAIRLLDVPFVPQQRALCGGAAVSMVMRYWGDASARASDYTALVEPGTAGIRARVLTQSVRDRGWKAWPMTGGIDGAAECLRQGRPLVALIRENSTRDHYVVIVAMTPDRVCVHDPARGPFRLLDRSGFERAWRATGEWALLILPGESPQVAHADSARRRSASIAPVAVADSVPACGALVESAVATARAGDLVAAETLLQRAHVLCSAAAAPLSELAGIRFLQGRWSQAESLAVHATRLDAGNTYAWQLLAASRYLRGDDEAALAAWNTVDEPRIDLTRIDGLGRTRYDVVSHFLGLRAGRVLTAEDLRRARRRLDTLPVHDAGRLSYALLPGGATRVDVSVLEKPRSNLRPRALPSAGAHALLAREAAVEVASSLGLGELWTASWRWWENRPRLGVNVTLPGGGVLWSAGAAWERQDVRFESSTTRFERRAAALDAGQWLSADVRWDAGASLWRWADRSVDVGVQGGIETRHAGDRVAFRASGSQLWNVAGGDPYAQGTVGAAWRSTVESDPNTVRVMARAGFAAVGAGAPRMLWPAAGSEPGCAAMLRAHPRFDHGVQDGTKWRRGLLHGSAESQSPPLRTKLASFRLATFIDVAKPGLPGSPGALPVQADVGLGLRMQLARASRIGANRFRARYARWTTRDQPRR